MKMITADLLVGKIYADRSCMGVAASSQAAKIIRSALKRNGLARVIVASAPSQNELIANLTSAAGIDWSRVTVFHMDEYVGLLPDHRASFRAYQNLHFLSKVTPANFHGIRGDATDVEAECTRYSALVTESAIDLVCMGIGENGHIAFNDPSTADFCDPLTAKVVELDELCRRQQVNDGCFPDIFAVPKSAITLTCTMLMSARSVVCVVPGSQKASAVAATFRGPISEICPATILRRHTQATMFLDRDSASGLYL